MDEPIILFDGVCNLCNFCVRFVLKRDPGKLFKFCPLQSHRGKNMLKSVGLPTDSINTMVLIVNDQCYTKSTAALHIAKRLKGLWPLLFGFIVIPESLRNWTYDFIAKNRYRWFGEKKACLIPTPEIRERFLE